MGKNQKAPASKSAAKHHPKAPARPIAKNHGKEPAKDKTKDKVNAKAPKKGSSAPASKVAKAPLKPVKKVELKKAEPKKVELKKAEPKKLEPKKLEVKKVEIKKNDVKKVDKLSKKKLRKPEQEDEEFLPEVVEGGEELPDLAEFDEELEEVEVEEEVIESGDVFSETMETPGSSDDDEVILTDAEGRRYCKVKDCDQIGLVEGYCRFHYLLLWKKIQVRRKILADGKLQRYVEELTSRYPDKFLEMIRKDLKTEKDFMAAIAELEIDESNMDNEFEDEAQTFIDEVRGVAEGSSISDDEEF